MGPASARARESLRATFLSYSTRSSLTTTTSPFWATTAISQTSSLKSAAASLSSMTAVPIASSGADASSPPSKPEDPLNQDQKKKKTTDNSKNSNIFLDYLGTIFLAGLGLIVVALVRSYKGGNNRNRMREQIEQSSALDPLEIEDLRLANAELTIDVFRQIHSELMLQASQTPDRLLLYADFVRHVRTALRNIKGEDAFTIELGHYLDRVVLDYMSRHGQITTRDPQPLVFWMTVLSLALNAPVPDRILALYQLVSNQHSDQNTNETDRSTVTVADTRNLVGYLQDTCQLTPDTQVVENPDEKYPIQQYSRGALGQLFEWDGLDSDELDIDAFSSILKSRAVCVWGECYHRRKVV